MNDGVLLVFALFTKHFVVDFPLQWEYQWQNKGRYGHPGGLIHAGLHGIGTYLCFVLCLPWIAIDLAICFAVADAVVHYHIDWAKMNLNARFGWRPESSEKFWWLLGLDQYLHALTYITMIGLLV
jgi:hypothetical protein